jgi:hypothetical protein
MQSSRAFQYLLSLLSVILSSGMASALPPDPRILSLIPRNSEIVDGSGAPRLKAGLASFLVFRTENAIDLREFKGLVGIDDSKAIRQIFLVGGTARPSPHFEHSLIAVAVSTDVAYTRQPAKTMPTPINIVALKFSSWIHSRVKREPLTMYAGWPFLSQISLFSGPYHMCVRNLTVTSTTLLQILSY